MTVGRLGEGKGEVDFGLCCWDPPRAPVEALTGETDRALLMGLVLVLVLVLVLALSLALVLVLAPVPVRELPVVGRGAWMPFRMCWAGRPRRTGTVGSAFMAPDRTVVADHGSPVVALAAALLWKELMERPGWAEGAG